jgi:hypothetical protein
MNTIKDVMFVDGIYTSISHIFTGLQCGIIFSYIFKLDLPTMQKMSTIELYIRLIFELFLMSVIIYWYTPIFNHFGKPFDGIYEYKRKEHKMNNSNMLFAISFLVGNKSLSDKVAEIINKSGMINIPSVEDVKNIVFGENLQEIEQEVTQEYFLN